MSYRIRPKVAADSAALAAVWTDRYGAPNIVSRGREHHPLLLEGFVVEEDKRLLGALTFARLGDELEVVTLDSFVENRGVGTALLGTIVELARAGHMRRVCLVTTNDNIRALRFYQRRGWSMAALHLNAIELAREIKPQIPETGDHAIAIRHEIEFEFIPER
jgi:GNAT superfamily N-acetyltransferase